MTTQDQELIKAIADRLFEYETSKRPAIFAMTALLSEIRPTKEEIETAANKYFSTFSFHDADAVKDFTAGANFYQNFKKLG